jgi:hypothetical protein
MSSNTDDSVQLGNLLRVSKPKTLSLVGLPANQTAFKVVRSDNSKKTASAATPVAKRITRSATNPLMCIAFTEMSSEDIDGVIKEYGLEDYAISAEDGVILAVRADLQSVARADLEPIKLTDKITAYVARADKSTQIKRADAQKHIKAVAFEFDAKRFDVVSAAKWLEEKNIDIAVTAGENPDASFVAKRSDVAEGVEVRRMEIDDGVIVLLIQDDEYDDIPDAVVEIISEAAYGNWGWGQLDFNARLADRLFCDRVSDACWMLQDTLNSIIFYSALPLNVRKQLITNTLAQFNDYVTAQMSALPQQVIVAVSSTVTRSHRQEKAVSTNTNTAPQATNTQRTDDAPAAAVVAAAPAAAEPITLTPAELDARIEAEIVRRADEAKRLAEEAENDPLNKILKRMDEQAAESKAIREELTGLKEKVEQPVVVRNDAAGQPEKTIDGTKVVQRKDVFKGLITGNVDQPAK